jgi:sec-independent protein translocase protein TatA
MPCGFVLFFGMPGGGELIVIGILVIVLLFGANKVPQLARSFGQAMGEFKKAKRETELDLKKFEDTVGSEAEALPKPRAKIAEKKREGVNIREVARYMGIETEGKTDEELEKEVQAKVEGTSQ